MTGFIEDAKNRVEDFQRFGELNQRDFGTLFEEIPENRLDELIIPLEQSDENGQPLPTEAELHAEIRHIEGEMKTSLAAIPDLKALWDQYEKARQEFVTERVKFNRLHPNESEESLLPLEAASTTAWQAFDDAAAGYPEISECIERIYAMDHRLCRVERGPTYPQYALQMNSSTLMSPGSKKVLSMDCIFERPAKDWDEVPLLQTALERMGLDADMNESGEGYKLLPSFAHQLHLVATENAPEIDFNKWRQTLDEIGQELSETRWEKRPSSRGVKYEHTLGMKSQVPPESPMLRLMKQLSPQSSGSIRLGIKADGVFHDLDSLSAPTTPRKIRNQAASCPLVCQVSGEEAVHNILIEGLGIQGIKPSPPGARISP